MKRDRRGDTRCAIYTRKSTEEGLEQTFNSLDAQREACAAYVLSQRHEGWMMAPELYDDGGFSGGNMDRPGLKQLMAEVAAGRIDVIVVYKVDRLTRSLADFAKIVEVLDAAGASFVSVTQAFNTTTSMGRLTLNVLLSFAQFEREVTGERIRDKVAASKRKGMWMGGVVPLGYDVKDRKLIVNEADAALVRHMFKRYTALGSVVALKAELDASGTCSRKRLARNGKTYGGCSFTMGALYALLKNRTYLGEIGHKGDWFPGQHRPIIASDMFDAAQALIETSRVNRLHGVNANDPSLLAGLIWDAEGRRMSPNHANKGTRRYRYYASRSEGDRTLPVWRVPAGDVDSIVIHQVQSFLGTLDDEQAPVSRAKLLQTAPQLRRAALLQLVERVEVDREQITIQLRELPDMGPRPTLLSVRASMVRAGSQVRVVSPADSQGIGRRDPALVKLIVKAHQARRALLAASDRSVDQIASEVGYTRNYFGMLLRIAYLAPDITSAILEGRQPAMLTRQRLARMGDLPLDWQAQRAMLGFA